MFEQQRLGYLLWKFPHPRDAIFPERVEGAINYIGSMASIITACILRRCSDSLSGIAAMRVLSSQSPQPPAAPFFLMDKGLYGSVLLSTMVDA
jgi:hypothetical protein